MSPELLTAAEEAYIAAEDRRNRQRATFKNGRRQLRCTSCGCWRKAMTREGDYPECRRCGSTDAPKPVTVYPRPENSPTWEAFLARFIEEDARAEEYMAERAARATDPDPIPF